ncbi:hypothetical protein FUAX_53480 (plasmid) [Fulvitalea axinellae]|uniref:Uncharacterized protein n=1 Tax=Fulvitalea axinellae TaxID=1182444 RepID=A0AAU9CV39_9BACT|nr:hypothetical protein FUAX_53480 [Fulvitalea axinellae]
MSLRQLHDILFDNRYTLPKGISKERVKELLGKAEGYYKSGDITIRKYGIMQITFFRDKLERYILRPESCGINLEDFDYDQSPNQGDPDFVLVSYTDEIDLIFDKEKGTLFQISVNLR